MEEFGRFNEDLNLDYCRASTGKRFANSIIDLIVFYIAFLGVLMVIEIFKPGLFEGIDGLADRLITMVCYALLMWFIEAISHGKSLGKLITGTKAVNPDGTDIDFQKAFVRNIVRAIPFNGLSALGNPCNPWQDRWTNTIVIDEQNPTLS